jgi:hypothetical protein
MIAPTMKRNRHHNTPFARRCRRLGLDLGAAARWLREPYGNVKNWNQGRSRCPRSVLRLLAAYRLIRWGRF